MKADSIPRSHHRGVNSPGALRLETLRPGDHLGPAGRSPRALTGPGQGSWGRVLGSRGGVAGSWALGVGSPGHGRPPPPPCAGKQAHQPGVLCAHLVASPGATAAACTALIAPPVGGPMSLDSLFDFPTDAHSSLWSVEPGFGLSLKAIVLVEQRHGFLPRCMPHMPCVCGDGQ